MIGQMRDRVKIKAPIDVEEAGGGAKSTYEVVLEDWSKVEPLRSSRVLQDNQINLNEGFTFNLRYRSAFTPDKTMLIEFESRDYTINSIQEVKERKRYWVITATGDGQPIQTT